MFAEFLELEDELRIVADGLVESLYQTVPRATDPGTRRLLLGLKRAAFNHRSLPEWNCSLCVSSAEALSQLRTRLQCYQDLIRRRDSLLSSSGTVLADLEKTIRDRVGAADFRHALAASSSTLNFVLDRSDRGAPIAARDWRSLYAYVCRFTTKANPLHLFTYLVPGKGMDGTCNQHGSPICEVVFEVQSVFRLERQLLARGRDDSRIRVAMSPLQRGPDGWKLWLKREGRWCVLFLPYLPIVERVRLLYDKSKARGGAPSFTRRELERALAEQEGESPESPAIRTALDGLIARGVLTEYLIDDLADPGRALSGMDEGNEAVVQLLKRWHLKRVRMEQLRDLENERDALPEPGTERKTIRYNVNSYADDDLGEAERAAGEICEALADLKPLLSVESDFSCVQRVIRQFLNEELSEGMTRPYLDLLANFLRRRPEILDRFGWGRECPEYEALFRRCRSLHGILDRAQVVALASELKPRPNPTLCFVGPFEFNSRRFFLNNIFAGDQRSVSRYLLSRRASVPQSDDRAGPLDVELAVPPEHDLNFVVKRFDTGFGFESRWARGYRLWLEPHEIVVGLKNGQPLYVHAPSGRVVRFQYNGQLLARYLPVEYQFLLAEHADTFSNPFASYFAEGVDAAVEHRPGVSFGPICLRRESWAINIAALLDMFHAQDAVRSTLELRRWIHGHLSPIDLWFYRLPRSGVRGQKPRFLDLANPLSVMLLRRALAAAPSRQVALSRMEPEAEGLWQVNGEAYVAELMVEV
jgi:hypothetical protein